jgi:GGDEF domain-containing protein
LPPHSIAAIFIGGDEFVIIVEGPSLELVHSTAYTIGEKIRKDLLVHLFLDSVELICLK